MNSHNKENNAGLKIYIDELHNDKLSSKLEKMSDQIKTLTKENASLTAKVNNLELIVEKLCLRIDASYISDTSPNFAKTSNEKNIFEIKREEIEETWLYWVIPGVNMEEIIHKLNFSIKETFSLDVEVDQWVDEHQVYQTLLSKFPNFQDEDLPRMNNQDLKHYMQSILSSTFVNDTVIVLRKLPVKKNKNYEAIMSNVAMLAGFMFNTWEELETTQEIIGRMGLILESEEKLEILNIIKDDSRLILLVDPLFEDNEI